MLRWLFTAPPDKPNTARYCVLDIGRYFFIDREYAQMGESEGWLVYHDYYRDQNNTMVYVYRHIT